MQRQSLGSPSPRIHSHGRGGASIEISSASPLPSSPSVSPVIVPCAVDDDDLKLEKLRRRRSSSPPLLRAGPEKYIHVIPIFTLLCFLVLFLCSHEPSPTELADFKGFKHPSELADSREIDQFERALDKGEMLAIRSLRNLQEIRKDAIKSSRSHRKLGDF
ncbi:hypothetical protein V2J09_020335 [Rumex salicifolius]